MARWAVEKNIYLKVILNDDQPLLIHFDRDKIIQVLVNLVSNAIKFTDEGGITILTAVRENEVVVSVKDEGIGIEEKDLNSLFKPFHQLGDAKNHKKGSTGLGLSISKSIIEAHDGKIWAKSKISKGTIFNFSIPLKAENP
jgi:signal transduction histidine kinase